MNEIIKSYLDAGLSIIPVKSDKRPMIPSWTHHQGRIATFAEADQWEFPVAAIGGKVSGGLVCIDFDNKGSEFRPWVELVKKENSGILSRVCYQQTPSGGFHIFFRSPLVVPNKKLARRKALPGELDKDGSQAKVVCLIETRGEGGYFLISPSKGYNLKRGDILNIETITEEETETLLGFASMLNQELIDEYTPPREIRNQQSLPGLSPLDDYDSKNTPLDVLQAHGWTITGQRGETTLLCRPGKKRAISATWNKVPNRLYVFTSSTEFDQEKVYKASAVYAILEHGKDFVAAARSLRSQGYGDQTAHQSSDDPSPAATVDVDDVSTSRIVKMGDYRDKIHEFYTKPRDAGYFLGIKSLDALIRFDKKYLNVITGVPSHGKSEVLDFIMTKLVEVHNWNFVVFSPENYPLEIYYNKLAQKLANGSLFGQEAKVIDGFIDVLDAHFDFIDATEEDLSIDLILKGCLEVKSQHRVDCLVIDPWNEIEMNRPKEMTENEYIGVHLRRLRKFARKNDLCIIVVAHPTKLQKIKDKDIYPVCTMYDINGSSNWYNKIDNGITVYRDFEKDITSIHVKKIKYRNYGKIGVSDFKFIHESGNFEEHTGF